MQKPTTYLPFLLCKAGGEVKSYLRNALYLQEIFMLPEIIWKIVKNVLQDRWRQDGRKRENHGNEHIAYRSGITAGAPRELSG